MVIIIEEMLHYGHIDDPWPLGVRGHVIYDLFNPPWASPLVGIPRTVVYHDATDVAYGEHHFAQCGLGLFGVGYNGVGYNDQFEQVNRG